jgi:hypothetical protein
LISGTVTRPFRRSVLIATPAKGPLAAAPVMDIPALPAAGPLRVLRPEWCDAQWHFALANKRALSGIERRGPPRRL